MGVAAGMTSSGDRSASIPYSRLNDFRMEYILQGGVEEACGKTCCCGIPRWKQQAQYAVGHTLNDYYSLRPEVRSLTPVQFLLERRWPPHDKAFDSWMHYWDVKTALADELTRIVSVNHPEEIPVMLYEQWHVPVPELGLELAMIFQLAWQSAREDRSLKLQKLMVHGNEEAITGFLHMANLFCHKAYGKPPESVEVFALLDGKRHCYEGSAFTLAESLDYVRLLSVFLNNESIHEPFHN